MTVPMTERKRPYTKHINAQVYANEEGIYTE